MLCSSTMWTGLRARSTGPAPARRCGELGATFLLCGYFVNFKLMLRPGGCSKILQEIQGDLGSFWYFLGPPTNLFSRLNN